MIDISSRYKSDFINIPNNFIVLSGLDGAGKSTQAKLLKKRLENNNCSCVINHHTIDENAFFLNTFQYIYNSTTQKKITQEQMGYFVAFEYLGYFVNNVIPLMDTTIPILDRGVFDLLASQTTVFGNSFNFGWILLQEIAYSGCHIFIDVPPDICFDRIILRKGKIKPHESLEALQKKYKVYQRQVEMGSLFLVNGEDDKKIVSDNILRCVKNKLNLM